MHSNASVETSYQSLMDRLRLRTTRPDSFISQIPSSYTPRVYGGHMLAQACLASTAQSDSPTLQSFNAYFLSPGNTQAPIEYRVSTIREGRSFTVRSVLALQGDKLLLSWQGLLGTDQALDEPLQYPCPEVPDPELIAPLAEIRAKDPHSPDGFRWPPGENWAAHSRPFDVRFIGSAEADPRTRCYWLRAEAVPGASQNEQRALLAFASDHSFATTVSHARGDVAAGIPRSVASLDHKVWFHRDIQAGDWHLFLQRSPFSSDRMGLAMGYLYNQRRELVATVMQQVLRPSSPGAPVAGK